jgi:hypothetical protein
MPHLVNGQVVSEELIQEELGRIGRDPQWQAVLDPAERAYRLRAAAEQSAQDRILIEQIAAGDPRPVDAVAMEQEVQRQKAQWFRTSTYSLVGIMETPPPVYFT